MITAWWFKNHLEKYDGLRQWVSDDIPYEMENHPNV